MVKVLTVIGSFSSKTNMIG